MAGPLAPLTLALAQVDPRVGDLEGNARLVREHIARARDAGAELVLLPELVLTGYPPEDLLLKEHFLQAAQEALADVAAEAQGIVAVVGYPERTEDVYNAIAVLADGEVARDLPQDAAVELRRGRRAALLPGRRGRRGARPRQRAARADDLRGHLGPRPARRPTRRSPARCCCQPVRVAVRGGQGRGSASGC